MIYDLQKGSVWKRISAFLFDLIVLSIVAVLIALLLAWATGVDEHIALMDEKYKEYGYSRDLDYEEASDEERAAQDAAVAALGEDDAYMRANAMVYNLALVIVTSSLFLAFFATEFVLPLVLKNGQTLGKKIFGIALMRRNGVRVNGPAVFIRGVLGKYAVETMIPVYLIVLFILTGQVDLFQLILLILIPAVNLFLYFISRTGSFLHDFMADTVVVDYASQMIFDSEEEMVAYKTRIHREAVENSRENPVSPSDTER